MAAPATLPTGTMAGRDTPTAGKQRRDPRLRSLRGAEGLRLIVAVVLAAGAVVLGEALTRRGHHSSASGLHSPQRTLAGGPAGTGGSGGSSTGGWASKAHSVVVAGGPAVERSLRRGSMIVVIDQPPPGLFAQQNSSIAQGAEVAVHELNAAGGLPRDVRIRLLRQSLDGLSATGVRAKLRSEAAAVLILPCDTDSQLSLAAGASQYGMLMLAPCNPDSRAGGRYATYWPVALPASAEAAGLVEFMKEIGPGSAFVVNATGNRYVELVTSDFRSAAQAGGIQLAGSATIAVTTKDFSGLAHAIEATNPTPSAIFTALPPPLVNRLASGLMAEGVHQTVVGSTAMDTPLTLSSSSPALESAVFVSNGFPRESASARRFAAEYSRMFGRDPVGSFPALGLETIRLLEAAVRKAGSPEPSAIQQALAGGISLSGVGLANRAYQRGGDHNPVGQVDITKISSGSFLPLFASTPKGVATP